jgi:HSP20 family protein
MALMRWSPNLAVPRDVTGIQDEVNRLFDSFFGRWPAPQGNAFLPAVDIEESAEDFIVKVDLPGLHQKDVKVSLMGDVLTIRGERKLEAGRSEGTLHRTERVYGTFERSFTLGAPVRNDKVKATFRDGVLEVQVPKAEEARLKEVEVQVG